MGATSYALSKSFQHFGGCLVEVKNDILTTAQGSTVYDRLSVIRNFSLQFETTKVMQKFSINGQMRTVQERTTGQDGRVSFTVVEMIAPRASKLLLGDPVTDQVVTAADVAADNISLELYEGETQYLTNQYALVPNADLGTLSADTPSTAGSGALSGTYYFWIGAGWGTAPAVGDGDATYLAEVDDEFVIGSLMTTPVSVDGTGKASITVATIANSYDAAAGGVDPDFLIVWGSSTNDITTADIWAVLAGTATTTSTMAPPMTTTAYAPSVGCKVKTVTNYSTGTATLTDAVSGTDFTYNSAAGTIARVTASTTILDGETVVVRYWALRPDGVKTTMGAPVTTQDTRQLRVTALEAEVDADAADPLAAEGSEIILYRVNFSGTNPNLGFTEEDWHPGSNIEVISQYDPDQACIGTQETLSRKLKNHVQNY